MNDTNRSRSYVQCDDSIPDTQRWVMAILLPGWPPMAAFLQAQDSSGGFWVQFDPDAPFRLVESVTPFILS